MSVQKHIIAVFFCTKTHLFFFNRIIYFHKTTWFTKRLFFLFSLNSVHTAVLYEAEQQKKKKQLYQKNKLHPLLPGISIWPTVVLSTYSKNNLLIYFKKCYSPSDQHIRRTYEFQCENATMLLYFPLWLVGIITMT